MSDCRAMSNPFWDGTLRSYTGRDKPMSDFFTRFLKTVEPFIEATEMLVVPFLMKYESARIGDFHPDRRQRGDEPAMA